MMLRTILISASLASVSLVALAEDMNYTNCDYFSGAYVGVSGLYRSTNDKITINNAVIADDHLRNVDIYAGHDGWGGGVFAGFGKLSNRAYFGAEIYGQAEVGKQKLVSIGDDYYYAIKAPYTYGATAKLGYLASPQALVYVGLGAENSRFKLINGTGNADHDVFDTHKWAVVPSVGMDLALNCNWQVGARFSYANYRSIDIPGQLDQAVGTVNPRRANFALNVTYHIV